MVTNGDQGRGSEAIRQVSVAEAGVGDCHAHRLHHCLYGILLQYYHNHAECQLQSGAQRDLCIESELTPHPPELWFDGNVVYVCGRAVPDFAWIDDLRRRQNWQAVGAQLHTLHWPQ